MNKDQQSVVNSVLERGLNTIENGQLNSLVDKEIDPKSYADTLLGDSKKIVEKIVRNVLNTAGDGKGTIAVSGFRNASIGPISGILTLGISSDDKLFIMLDAGLGKAAGFAYNATGDFPMPASLKKYSGDATAVGLTFVLGARVGPFGGGFGARGVAVSISDNRNRTIATARGVFEGPYLSNKGNAFGISGGALAGVTFGYKYNE
ncbi:MAG: hypothetical protein KUG78_21845 [Kangiellaceae bacterium]|nr:hypothetical protein [Kangiellaceae bacterium]